MDGTRKGGSTRRATHEIWKRRTKNWKKTGEPLLDYQKPRADADYQILMGQKVTVVRCEEINISGSFFRNKLKYHAYLHSTCSVLLGTIGMKLILRATYRQPQKVRSFPPPSTLQDPLQGYPRNGKLSHSSSFVCA